MIKRSFIEPNRHNSKKGGTKGTQKAPNAITTGRNVKYSYNVALLIGQTKSLNLIN